MAGIVHEEDAWPEVQDKEAFPSLQEGDGKTSVKWKVWKGAG
jgi:hypothetical protein